MVNRSRQVSVPSGVFLIMFAAYATSLGYLFQYDLWCIAGKDIPWYGDAVAGVFASPVVLPIAVTCWVLRLCGLEVPFVH